MDPQTFITVTTHCVLLPTILPRIRKATILTLHNCTSAKHFCWTISYWMRIFIIHCTLWVSERYGRTNCCEDFCISQRTMKWKNDRGPVLSLSTDNISQWCLHTCMTLSAIKIRCFNTNLFIIMLKSSGLFTIASNFFATIQATNIKTGCALEKEKVDMPREGTLQDSEKGSISNTSPLILQEVMSIFE